MHQCMHPCTHDLCTHLHIPYTSTRAYTKDISIRVYIYTHTHMGTCMHACMHAYKVTYIHVYIHTCIVCICMCRCVLATFSCTGNVQDKRHSHHHRASRPVQPVAHKARGPACGQGACDSHAVRGSVKGSEFRSFGLKTFGV